MGGEDNRSALLYQLFEGSVEIENADAAVLHRDAHAVVSPAAAYADLLGGVRVLGRVVEQVDQGLGHGLFVEVQKRQVFVDRLVLIATSAVMPVNRDLMATAAEKDPAAAAMIMKWSLAKPRYGRPKTWLRNIEESFVTAARGGVLAMDLAACDSYDNATTTAAGVRCPTLLILGERDVMTKPAAAQPLAAALEDARIVMIDGGGHMLPLENSAAVNEAITLFLATP